MFWVYFNVLLVWQIQRKSFQYTLGNLQASWFSTLKKVYVSSTCNCFICKVITNPDEIGVANVFLLCHYSCLPFTPRRAWITTWSVCLICKSPLYLFFFVSHLPCDIPPFHPVSPEWIPPFPPLTTLASDILGASQGFANGNTACPLPRTKCHFPSFLLRDCSHTS